MAFMHTNYETITSIAVVQQSRLQAKSSHNFLGEFMGTGEIVQV